MLNSKQQEIVNLAVAGHNLYINGYAGTGKTYTVNEIFKTLTSIGKNVVITCSTGIACTNYTNAYTIHRWSGINDGRYSSTELITRILGNTSALERLTNTDVLIIDEISMISVKLFDQVVTLLTEVKNKSKFCGGMQLIVAGDFYQLPPVPNKHYNDSGDFCFNSVYFKQLHRVTLTDIVRQNDIDLIRAIREVSEGGDISEDTVNYIKNLERPLSGTKESIKLFANNDLVSCYNRSQIEKQPGIIYEYVAVDKGQSKYLGEITAVPKLWLKIGCPVVLIRNLSNVLVNGLQGKVVGFSSDGPHVHFTNNQVTTINKVSFTVFSTKENTILAERLQIPLLLSYALTVHKSQGMTLDRVDVDCQQMFKAGQLGVAMGRVRNSDGLRVVNFNRNICFPQPQEVTQYLLEAIIPLVDDLSCCTDNPRPDEVIETCWFGEELEEHVTGLDSDLDMLEDDFNDIIRQIDIGDNETDASLPESFNLLKVIEQLKIDEPVTPIQEEINQVVNDILSKYMTDCKDFCHAQFAALSSVMETLAITPGIPVKPDKLTEFYCAVRQHQISDNYTIACLMLFRMYSKFTGAHSSICTHLFDSIRKFLLLQKISLYEDSDRNVHARNITDASKARIRYVAGYCVGTVRQKYLLMYRANMFSTSVQGQSQYHDAKCILDVLEQLKVHDTSADTDSLRDIERRQYANRSLITVSDEVYNLFIKLCSTCLNILVDKNVNIYGHTLHEYCSNKLVNSCELLEDFQTIINSKQMPVDFYTYMSSSDEAIVHETLSNIIRIIECQSQVFKELVSKFIMVMFNQFRKDLLLSFSIQKTLAHRKQVLVKQKKRHDK